MQKGDKIGEYIREWRQVRRLNQKECGDIFGVTRVTISSWETGKSKPPNTALLLIEAWKKNEKLLADMLIALTTMEEKNEELLLKGV
jgi:transcriptional regulator with XRE-family HTH domain